MVRVDRPIGFQLEVIANSADLMALEPAWTRLFNRDTKATPLQHFHFAVRGWLLRDEGASPRCLVVRDPAGVVVGILPLAIARRRHGPVSLTVLRPLAQPRVANFDALVDPDCVEPTNTMLFEGVEQLAREVDEVDLRFIRESSWLGSAWGLRDTPLVWRSTPAAAVQLTLDGGVGSWQDLVARSTRDDIRRLRRRLEAVEPVTLGAISIGPTFQSYCRRFLELHSARAHARGWAPTFATGRQMTEFPALLEHMARDGLATFYGITRGTDLIAGQIVLRAHGLAHSFRIAFDPAWAHFGPGVMLHSVVIQDCIDRGDHTFDFGHDRDAYKRRWASRFETNFQLSHVTVSPRYRAAQVYSRVMHWLQRAGRGGSARARG